MEETYRRRLSPYLKDWRRYHNYRDPVRVEFRFRCAYCGVHECELPSTASWHLDHFRPKKKFPELANVYDNIYYACNSCNLAKSDLWPADDDAPGFEFVDPCKESLTDRHARKLRSEVVAPITPAGEYTIGSLQLNRRVVVRLRRERNQVREELSRELARLERMSQRALSCYVETMSREAAELHEELRSEIRRALAGWRRVKRPLDEG